MTNDEIIRGLWQVRHQPQIAALQAQALQEAFGCMPSGQPQYPWEVADWALPKEATPEVAAEITCELMLASKPFV